MPIIIYGLGGGHTHTQLCTHTYAHANTHTNTYLRESDFKKPHVLKTLDPYTPCKKFANGGIGMAICCWPDLYLRSNFITVAIGRNFCGM